MQQDTNLVARPITTKIFKTGENLIDFICNHISREVVHERLVVAITSKIVSLAENRLVSKSAMTKAELIAREADYNLGEVGYGSYLTIKHGLLIPSAGIDESNSQDDQYILYPENPQSSARQIWLRLREIWGLKDLGVILTDSHTSPLRKGVTGICLAHWGFKGVRDLIGTNDLFGRQLKMTTINVADALATTATLVMGEGEESRPLALLNWHEVEFTDQNHRDELAMPLKDDLYFPILKPALKKL